MIEYYRTLVFDEKIDVTEVSSIDSYVKAYRDGKKISKAELFLSGTLERVAYFSDEAKKDQIFKDHKNHYGDLICEVHSSGDAKTQKFIYNSDGLDFYIDEFTDNDGNLVKEEKYSSDSELIEVSELSYSEDGELLSIKDFRPDGSLIEETIFDD